MNHLGNNYHRNAQASLRRFVKEDAAAAFQNWTSDEKVTEFLTWPLTKARRSPNRSCRIGSTATGARTFINGPSY